jgi:hypothetical protein
MMQGSGNVKIPPTHTHGVNTTLGTVVCSLHLGFGTAVLLTRQVASLALYFHFYTRYTLYTLS